MSTFQAIKRSAATETPQQRKKAKTENTSKPSIEAKVISKTLEKNESGEAYVSISSSKRVTVREYKGVTLVDIREYYKKDDKMLPGKKGISLTLDQWKALINNIPSINTAIADK